MWWVLDVVVYVLMMEAVLVLAFWLGWIKLCLA